MQVKTIEILHRYVDFKNPAQGRSFGQQYKRCNSPSLKVLTNEKRGGLAVVTFDRYRFKLFSRKFSNKFVLAPSCERPKTAPCSANPVSVIWKQQLFHNNGIVSEAYEKIWELACHVVNSNIAIGSFPTLQTSPGIVAFFEKIYYEVPIHTVF